MKTVNLQLVQSDPDQLNPNLQLNPNPQSIRKPITKTVKTRNDLSGTEVVYFGMSGKYETTNSRMRKLLRAKS
jgi:hypothetical protein